MKNARPARSLWRTAFPSRVDRRSIGDALRRLGARFALMMIAVLIIAALAAALLIPSTAALVLLIFALFYLVAGSAGVLVERWELRRGYLFSMIRNDYATYAATFVFALIVVIAGKERVKELLMNTAATIHRREDIIREY